MPHPPHNPAPVPDVPLDQTTAPIDYEGRGDGGGESK